MKTIIVLALFFATYFVLKFIQIVYKRLGKKYKVIRTLYRMYPLFVSISWLAISFWSAHFLFSDKSHYNLVVTCIIVVLSVLTGWFFIKDFVAGVIFRVQNNFEGGDFLQVGELSGEVEFLYLTHISLNTKEGKNIKIPYSRLSSEFISKGTKSKTFDENTYILKTSKKNTIKSTEEAIRNALILSPWRINNKQSDVKYAGQDDRSYSFKIQVQVRNQKHFDYLTEVLEKRFNT